MQAAAAPSMPVHPALLLPNKIGLTRVTKPRTRIAAAAVPDAEQPTQPQPPNPCLR